VAGSRSVRFAGAIVGGKCGAARLGVPPRGRPPPTGARAPCGGRRRPGRAPDIPRAGAHGLRLL